MKYKTEIGRSGFGLTIMVCLFSFVFTSCSNSKERKEDEKNSEDTIVKSKVKKLPGISFEDQLELEKKYPDSISIKVLNEFYGIKVWLNGEYCKISIDTMDLNQDNLPDKIVSLEGNSDGGWTMCRWVLFNMKDYWKVGGYTTQVIHSEPMKFNQIALDKNSDKYLVVNTQGWGSGYYADVINFYRIQNDSIEEAFFYNRHSSYMIGEIFDNNQQVMEITDSKHEFLNDSTLKMTINVYYINDTDENNVKESQVFSEIVWLRWSKIEKDFKVYKYTNENYKDDFYQLSYTHIYGKYLKGPYFKLSK